MRLSRTLCRYVLREILIYAALGLVAFSGILILQNLMRRLEDLVAVGLSAREAVDVVLCLLAMLGAYALPVAFLFGVLVAVGRLSADGEITAMRTCGAGIGTLLVPALVLAVVVSGVTVHLMTRSEPKARQRLRGLLIDVASRGGVLEAGRFQSLGKSVVFVRSRDRDNRLDGIVIADRSDPDHPFLVFAERGRFEFDPGTLTIHLRLRRGEIHLEPVLPDDPRYRRVSFQSLDYAIDARPLLREAKTRRLSEMTLAQLQRELERVEAGELAPEKGAHDPLQIRTQIQRRLALPFAPILFALLGVPLGIRRSRGARSWGALVCAAVVFVYYTLLSLGSYLAESGRLAPGLALWLPNLSFAAAALPLLARAGRGEN